MDYTDTAGNAATGVVWSPGPLPGTVWVLPYSGAPQRTARVVSVQWRRQVDPDKLNRHMSTYEDNANRYGRDERQGAWLDMFRNAPRMAPKLWHSALGYDPRDVVRNGGTLPLPLAA
jgi:hypothetical protein